MAVSVVLSHLFEDKMLIGHYEKLLLIGGALSFFWVSGIFNAYVPLYSGLRGASKLELVGITLKLTSMLGVGVGALTLLVGHTLYPEVGFETWTYFGIFTGFSSASFLPEYHFLLEDKKLALPLYGLLIYLAQFLAIVLPLCLHSDLATAMYYLAIVGGLRYAFQLILLKHSIQPKKSRETSGLQRDLFRKLLKSAVPAGLAILIGGSAHYVDSFIVTAAFSNEEFALFTYGAKELPIIMLLANAVSTVKSGDLAKAKENGESEESVLKSISGSAATLCHLFFPISIVLLFFSESLFSWVFKPGFAGSAPIFNIYLLLVVPRLLFPQAIVRGLLKMKVILMATAAELFLNISLSLIFLKFWGLEGIAMATVLAYLFEKILLVIWVKNKAGINLLSYHPVFIWSVYSLVLFLAYLLLRIGFWV